MVVELIVFRTLSAPANTKLRISASWTINKRKCSLRFKIESVGLWWKITW